MDDKQRPHWSHYEQLPYQERQKIAEHERRFYPDSPLCRRCGMPFAMIEAWPVFVDGSGEWFVLCKPCWHELPSAAHRLPYYEVALDMFLHAGGLIEDVLALRERLPSAVERATGFAFEGVPIGVAVWPSMKPIPPRIPYARYVQHNNGPVVDTFKDDD